jgi:predicted protein tyrosine phosphatase
MNTVNHYTDFANAEKYAKDYHAVISLGYFLPEQFRERKKYLFLDFEDITFDQIHVTGATFKDCPNEGHVRQIIEFVRELSPVDKLLVHCMAGYSRSPAAVVIAKCERDGKTIHDAKQELYDARIPDKLVPRPNDIMLHNYLMIK